MAQTSKTREIKQVLGSIKNILGQMQVDVFSKEGKQPFQQSHGQLQLLLKKIRVSKLQQAFLEKLTSVNVYNQPVTYHLQSQRQIDNKRIIKLKGISIDDRILSLIYLLDIIFCLVTFVTGAFRAFIDAFTSSGTHDQPVFIALMIIAIIVTSMKIIANSITKTIEDGILLVYLTDILKNYLMTFFVFIDLAYVGINIASLSVGNDNAGIAVALFILSLVKLFSLYDNMRVFQITFINSFRKEQYFNLVKVVLFNILFAHFVGSLLLAMSKFDSEDNWRVIKGISQESWIIQYIWAYYWACTIMMTVGFGDFSAFNFRQAIIVAFLQLFSCIVLAFNISEIGNIISSIRSSQTQFRRRIAIFKRMAKYDHIEQQLQRRIEGYLRQQTQIKQRFQFNQQSQILASIPQNLRNEYIVQSNKNMFPQLPFFKNLQKTTLIKFTQKFNGKVFYPGQYLTKLQSGDEPIMILKTGKVGFAYKKYGSYLNGTIVQEAQVIQRQILTSAGQYDHRMTPLLLNTDFLSQKKKKNYDIIAQAYSFVFYIQHQDFFVVINTSQIDSSYYFSIKHKHSVIQNQWQQLPCQNCSMLSRGSDLVQESQQSIANAEKGKSLMAMDKMKYHTKFNCPKLHYFPMNRIVILKSIHHQGEQQRRDQSYDRFKKQKITCLTIRKDFFSKYEKARNLSYAKCTLKQIGVNLWQNFGIQQVQNKAQIQQQNKQNLQEERRQHIMTVERVVRQAIQQAFTGYKSGFWDLQIDQLYNYTNYFPLQNSRNFDFFEIGKTKQKRMNSSIQRRVVKTVYF